MMTVYYREQGVLKTALMSRVKSGHQGILDAAVWIDVQDSSPEEERFLKDHLQIVMPSRSENWRNHALNRLYCEGGVAFMTAALLYRINSSHPKTSPITFILSMSRLITVRNMTPASFGHFQQRLLGNPDLFTSAPEILEGLLQEIFVRLAWYMEFLVDGLDDLSRRIFDDNTFENHRGNPSVIMRGVLKKLGGLADLNSKIHESLQSLERMLIFFKRLPEADKKDLQEDLDTLIGDADALIIQTNFMSDKISFQLDSALGMINVEQNLISKIFSVVAVFFMPPTLVSSIYGMNFAHMPELHWMFGYPLALGMMVVVWSLTYIYFKRRGWL